MHVKKKQNTFSLSIYYELCYITDVGIPKYKTLNYSQGACSPVA